MADLVGVWNGNTFVNLRPNGTALHEGGWGILGASPTHHAATSDNVDATYLETVSPSGAGHLVLDVDSYPIPAGAIIKAVYPQIKAQANAAGKGLHLYIGGPLVLLGTLDPISIYGPDVPLGTWVIHWNSGAIQRPGGGGGFTQADLDAMQIVLLPLNGAGGIRITEAYLTVQYNQRPTVVASSPADGATLVDLTRPTVAWTYSDPEANPCERIRVKVFSGAGAVTNPDTETARLVYDSGELLTAATSHKIATPLANGAYRWAVKAADALSNGRYSLWTQRSLTVTFTPPPVPIISPDPEPELARVSLGLNPVGTPTPDYFEVQRSDDDGTTWNTIRGGDLVGTAPDLLTIDEATAGTGWLASANMAAGFPQPELGTGLSGDALLLEAAAGGDVVARLGRRAPVTEGTTYSFIARAQAVTTVRNFTMTLHWYNADGTTFASSASPSTADVTSGYATTQASAVAPVGAVTVEPRLTVAGAAAGEHHRFDELSVYPRGIPPATITDREVPRRRTGNSRWRARSTRWLDPIGSELATSAWSAGVLDALTPDSNAWLKSPTDSTLDLALIHETTRFETLSTEAFEAYYASGRRGAVVIGGDITGERFTLDLFFINDSGWRAFEALRGRRETLLLQTCFGDSILEQFWVRLGPDRRRTNLTHDKMATSQPRRVTVDAVEVDAPAGSPPAPSLLAIQPYYGGY